MTGTSSGTVGFCGLGMMGAPLAGNLLRKGVPLIVHNRTPEKAGKLLEAGARWAETPRAVAEGASSGLVFTVLSDARALREVLWGRHGIARGLSPSGLVVDMSTIAPDQSRTMAGRLATRGLHFVDAPLGGSVDAAEAGAVLFYVGGDPSDVERVRPYLERMGRGMEFMGPVGSGTAMKLVNNLLTIGHVALLSEALALSEGLGLPRGRVLSVLSAGGAASRMLESKRDSLERREYPARFLLRLARKDVDLVVRTGRRSRRETPFAREIRRLLREAGAQGHDLEDFSAMAEAALRRLPARPPEGSTGTGDLPTNSP